MMVQENCQEQREVSWYARELGLAPKYLSDIVDRMHFSSAPALTRYMKRIVHCCAQTIIVPLTWIILASDS